MNRRKAAVEARRSLDRLLAPYRTFNSLRPQRGWIRAIRDALGMTGGQLGRRLAVSQSTVQKLERSEQEGTIQLNSLRRVAEALNCELVYTFVPREPLERTYETAAREVALRELQAINHSMALENQSVNDPDDNDRLRRFIEDELDPREVWAGRP